MHVMWHTLKCEIDANGNNLILTLDFHSLKGVRDALWWGNDLCLKLFFLISVVHLMSYNGQG